MKYVDFYGNKVSKLIIGDNPFNGHSYIPEFVSKEEMIENNYGLVHACANKFRGRGVEYDDLFQAGC